ncbi:hypothetical protein SAMCFNEI73_pC0209 (plasmid) [Sinorhizobium americanum]|uniref:Uncharacterized protein n=1 Tax=Sinorhizobium americanum TaxID=194963 RepID=A0A1L3LV43_9HYPH|nr:hypothetical protein SAMCFNEI73_pC0209 [Sinorhizobium americanum]OAP34038.1 hypothetical protein ATC00_28515 [Sinorhizobium americanum]
MKIRRAKKKHPEIKAGGPERLTEEGFSAIGRGSHGLGFSYRGMWAHEGCPGTFEAWLVSKGIVSSGGSRH